MGKIDLVETDETPKILLSKREGIFLFRGRSIPHNAEKVYAPIINWFEEYFNNQNEETLIEFELDYFNTSTQKYLAELFKLMNTNRNKSKTLKVVWKYSDEDEDMRMIGEQFQYFVDFKFDFVEIPSEV